MRRLKALFRQKRAFELEQVAGFLLLGGALALFVRPTTVSLEWLGALWGIDRLWLWVFAALLMCGVALCLSHALGDVAFALLTAPVLAYGVLIFAYAIARQSPIFVAGMFGAFWIFMQSAHAQQTEGKKWTKQFGSSASR